MIASYSPARVSAASLFVLLCLISNLPAQQLSQQAKGPQVPPGVRVLCDLRDGRVGERKLLLDLYVPEKAAEGPLPLIVWVHGGGWAAGSKDNVGAAGSYRGVTPWRASAIDSAARRFSRPN